MTTAETEEKAGVILSLQDPVRFNVKHPLQTKWTLWFDDPALQKANPKQILTWEENLKNISTFDSVENFWGLINNLKKPSEIPYGSNYHLFKEGIKPMWEEAENKKGGKWTYVQDRKKKSLELNTCWVNTVSVT